MCDGVLAGMFAAYKRTLVCVLSNSTRLHNAAGAFTIRGPTHYLAINADIFLQMLPNTEYTVCGIACHTRLQALTVVVQHELVHLLGMVILTQNIVHNSSVMSVSVCLPCV